MHDFASLVLHFHFLAGVALELFTANLGNQVEGNLVREHLGLIAFALQQRLHFAHQLHRAACAGTGNSLIGGGSHGADGADGIEGIDGCDGDNGGAVGVRDDAVMVLHILGVDFGNHQGYIFIQPEGGGVVNKDSTGLYDGGGETLGNVVFRCTQHDVHALKGIIAGFLDGHFLALEGYGLAGRAGRGQRNQLAHGKIPFGQNLHHFLSYRTGGTQDGYSVLFHIDSLLF